MKAKVIGAVAGVLLAMVSTASVARADFSGFPIAIGTPGAGYKADPAVWGTKVVWEDYLHSAGNSNICGYDLATSSSFGVGNSPGYNNRHPRISGNKVVWDINDMYIRGYDFSAGTQIPLPTVSTYAILPDIHDNIVVYRDTSLLSKTIRESTIGYRRS